MEVTFDCPHCDGSITAENTAPQGRASCPHCHETALIPAAGIEPGMMIGDFRVESCIGVGGMGEVFLANQVSMDRQVALKVLPPAVSQNPALAKRFMAEIRTAGKLEHTNIVTAFYAGRHTDEGSGQDYQYLAMSYVDGNDLESRIKHDTRIPEQEALQIIRKVAGALDYAWQRHRLLHRDIKPANIMIDSGGEVKLMDMGIAKVLTEESNLTMAGVMLGTPFYMSPEQAKNVDDLDCRTDIYALGASLYHMVTGCRPFEGPTALSVIAQHLNDDLPDPRERFGDISTPCSRLISKMMEKDPDLRPADWGALIADVDLVLKNQSPAAPGITPGSRDLAGHTLAPAPDAAATLISRPDTTMPGAPMPATSHAAQPAASPAPYQQQAAETSSVQEYIDAMPVNPSIPRSLKLTLLTIGLLICGLFAAWIAKEVYDISRAEREEQLTKELEQKSAELKEKEAVGSIEAALAGQTAKAEIEAKEKARLKQLDEMVTFTRDYTKKNPQDPEAALAKFQRINEQAAGTRIELMIADDIRRLEGVVQRLDSARQFVRGTWVSTRVSGPQSSSSGVKSIHMVLNDQHAYTLMLNDKKVLTGSYRVSPGNLHFFKPDSTLLQSWPYTREGDSLIVTPLDGVTVNLRKE